jgi:hypothetical protein
MQQFQSYAAMFFAGAQKTDNPFQLTWKIARTANPTTV